MESLKAGGFNRLVIGACMPCVYGRKLADLGKQIALSPALMDMVDIHTAVIPGKDDDPGQASEQVHTALKMALEKLRNADPFFPSVRRIARKALVIGGGIAGMTAALAIADHGFPVDLIEKTDSLGGLARHVHRTIDGISTASLIDSSVSRVEKHPNIAVHLGAEVIHSQGWEGDFRTTVELKSGGAELLEHGVTILATGGMEAPARSYCYGNSESILTQHELEDRISGGRIDPAGLQSVAMIQCVGSREPGRNYCSRVCCTSALKHALYLKERNSDLSVYIFYRDMMTYGFLEFYYTQAREKGVIFIQYGIDAKPDVSIKDGGGIRIVAPDPILGRNIVLEPDMLVLSTGIVPDDQRMLADLFGIDVNEDGFFREAEYKWQPVNSRKQGVFLCGIAHSPRSIPESIATAQAAAQRALGMLNREDIPVGNAVAQVRHSLCSLCERCIPACPYDARRRSDEDTIEVDELACQGCGACAAVCPNSAAVIRGCNDRQVFSMLDAALE